MPCPACKIIIDGGRLAAAADLLGDIEPMLRGPARFLSGIVRWNTNAITQGIKSGAISGEQIDEAHAWSELQCHRAEKLERFVVHKNLPDRASDGPVTSVLLMEWAREDRLHATALAGGEYHGAWEINGVTGIRKKTE